MSLAKKRKKPQTAAKSSSRSDSDSDWANNKAGAPASKKKKRQKASRDSSSSESNWDDDSQDEEQPARQSPAQAQQEQKPPEQATQPAHLSEQEEGEVSDSDSDKSKSNSSSSGSDSSSSSSSSSDSEFDDGFDDDLMGDEEDRRRLNALSEKERETEIYKRIEQREFMRTRWEIERKLKLARRGEKNQEKSKNKGERAKKKKEKREKKAKKAREAQAAAPPQASISTLSDAEPKPSGEVRSASPLSSPALSRDVASTSAAVASILPDDQAAAAGVSDYFDHKERSKERKKNVEANKTDDKRSNAMALLKAKREGKAKRGKLLNFNRSHFKVLTFFLPPCRGRGSQAPG